MSGSVDVEILGSGPRRVGRLTLNAPKTLNSLTRDMVEVLSDRLMAWRDDAAIAAVVIDGAGDKAFCAGGDVQALRDSSIGSPGGPCDYAENFFAREYRMNYILHTYPKPVVCWGHGVVMGGGLGVLAGCSHRVVSERTRIGMPEVTIALFPDVGGSWFLNRMPGELGRFLALTAANINATDALFAGLGSQFLAHSQHDMFLAALVDAQWSGRDPADVVADVIAGLVPAADRPAAQVEPHMATINTWMAGEDLAAIVDRVVAWQGDDPWLSRARDGLAHGSKLAASWIFRQLNSTRQATLEEVFASELRLATHIMRHPEFGEGVRALLVDKDRNPQWTYPSVVAVPGEVLDSFFIQPDNAPDLDLP